MYPGSQSGQQRDPHAPGLAVQALVPHVVGALQEPDLGLAWYWTPHPKSVVSHYSNLKPESRSLNPKSQTLNPLFGLTLEFSTSDFANPEPYALT